MTEQTAAAVAAADYNPFDDANFAHGGGLWDGKTVTITRAQARTEAMKRKDGSAVLDEKTKEPVIQTALVVWGIADGGDDKERYETYGAGDKMIATPDGEGFVSKDGGPAKFHASSGVAKFSDAAKAGGFVLSTLIVDGKQKVSRLTGARFVMKAEAKLGKDGKPIKDAKGYDKSKFLPVKFVGYAAAGASATVPAVHATGAAGGNGDALKTKAVGAVLGALAAGPLKRSDLIRKLATDLAGDPDSNAIIGLVVRDDFHKGAPWQYDGLVASL